ncbi:hypothetical protein [Flavobacterium silvaticum]|uniref:PKD domain-containing protein n=1 Tax=Flavobacterium silvaticum TaxID=1852020 RepID=A0A972FVV4_9FLAO|nr:hypothetical protein [Flavobacterium silvaticum]NMH29663.1 hypothetical protein [Flavobacterium silvaticum]
MKNNKTKFWGILALAGMTLAACSPEEVDGDGNGIINTLDLDATFTVTEVSANHYRVQSGETRATSHYWSDGSVSGPDGDARDYFFPDAADYTITHRVCGIGGQDCLESVQTVHVPVSDPVQGNIVVNPKFLDGSTGWTILNISPSGAQWTFNDGSASLVASGFNQQAIYQPIQVEGGHTYKFDMTVSSPGLQDTWFELYADYAAPTQNSDYSAGGRLLQINTWGGCGGSAFNGQLSSFYPCGSTSDVSGQTRQFATSGTVYLLIKSGGGNANLTVTNVEVRRID